MPDFTDLNKDSLNVLRETHKMLMAQVEHDATPEFLSELKSKICAGFEEVSHPGIVDLANLFQNKGLNPLNLPFEYLLNGTLPTEMDETSVQPQPVRSSFPAERLKAETNARRLKRKLTDTTQNTEEPSSSSVSNQNPVHQSIFDIMQTQSKDGDFNDPDEPIHKITIVHKRLKSETCKKTPRTASPKKKDQLDIPSTSFKTSPKKSNPVVKTLKTATPDKGS